MSTKEEGLSAWHLTMLALGTVVGGSFFLGSAVSIKAAGPGILISYLLAGTLVYIVLTALSEMTIAEQAPGSFRTYAEQMYGPLVGFVLGWVYWTGLILAMSSEATAAAMFIQKWLPGISLPFMAALIIVAVTLVNLLGAKLLATLESGLALIKVSAVIAFIGLAIALIIGIMPGIEPIGLGALKAEPLFPRGISGLAGAMLIVIFTYAGFEIIGLSASEASEPTTTIPRAIKFTVFGLVGLYVLSLITLLPLIPTAALREHVSPFVAALSAAGLDWVATPMNAILILAIVSTMLAAMFGLGRMVRSLADKGYAPSWLKSEGEVPRRGILFSGAGMLVGIGMAYLLPNQIYLFLVSSGGFAFLFSYAMIMATHYKYRKETGCPPDGNCQLMWYPYTTIFAFVALVAAIFSMPLIPGQGSGLFAGLILVAFYTIVYMVRKAYLLKATNEDISFKKLIGLNTKGVERLTPQTSMEASDELTPKDSCQKKNNDNNKKNNE
ncbi:gamma-aminobutyrate permease-like transporter [Halobacteroides halobius DSM 5150]|uniref:Gamma-aminobutyrate permease-like transporter n=1 Tax=Halobacteroides halobius (strain ATCC 35273 / DSM 5150 / MD-1) TaxID=748449 RepID=L0KBJ7_HALHC|nr:amino acid permease [Halobacteroides halobius]AGB42371.1 gamma-aminobutyrate permease-like transporter [Halobacteroides halobius DSM 5150]